MRALLIWSQFGFLAGLACRLAERREPTAPTDPPKP
jgi:hypothetical protein